MSVKTSWRRTTSSKEILAKFPIGTEMIARYIVAQMRRGCGRVWMVVVLNSILTGVTESADIPVPLPVGLVGVREVGHDPHLRRRAYWMFNSFMVSASLPASGWKAVASARWTRWSCAFGRAA
jgi:hypothetical protein